VRRAAEAAGLYKLTSCVFADNAASIAAHVAAGFEVVGVQRRHGRLDGEWKDCVLVERCSATRRAPCRARATGPLDSFPPPNAREEPARTRERDG
jgi:beta-phosphoglucomutase-like phosphatase (HAD superfamily)